jgi:hypothetical protein
MATPVLPRGLAATPLATKPAHLPLLAEQHRGGGNVARAPRPFSLLGLGRSQPQPTAPPPTPRAPVARAQQQQAQVQPQGPSPLSGNLAGRKAVEAWSAGVSGVVRAGIGASGAAARPSTAQVREDDPWAALDDGKRRAAIAHDRRCQAEVRFRCGSATLGGIVLQACLPAILSSWSLFHC